LIGKELCFNIFSPALKFRDIHREKPVGEPGEAHFLHLAFDKCFHFDYCHAGLSELTIGIAVAAKPGAFQSVGFGAAMIGIFAERHAAALAEFVSFFHFDYFKLNDYKDNHESKKICHKSGNY
jgi:hypothetical protein